MAFARVELQTHSETLGLQGPAHGLRQAEIKDLFAIAQVFCQLLVIEPPGTLLVAAVG